MGRDNREMQLSILLLGLATLLWTVQPPPDGLVETVYVQGLYPWLSAAIVPLTDALPFSVSAAYLLIAPFFSVVVLGMSWQKRDGETRPAWARRWVQRYATVGVVSYGCFLFLWGANYARVPVEQRLTFQTSETNQVSSDDLLTLSLDLAALMTRDLPGIGVRDTKTALESLRASLSEVVTDINGRAPTLPHRVKRLPPGLLLRFGVQGVASPYSLEAHVDGAITGPAFLAVAAHELAHVAGFSGEADADFVAALAGLRADDPYARYALSLSLFNKSVRGLSYGDRMTAYEALPDAARADLRVKRGVGQRYRVQGAARVSTGVNNAYLRVQGVEGGVADYDRTVRLLVVATQRGLVPSLGGQFAATPDAAN